MRRRGKIGLAILALALAGGAAYVGMERPRPPLVIRVAAQQEEAVQAAAQKGSAANPDLPYAYLRGL